MNLEPALRPAQAPLRVPGEWPVRPSFGRQADLSNELEPPLGGGSGERCMAPPGA
jgi:hypothetical protein